MLLKIKNFNALLNLSIYYCLLYSLVSALKETLKILVFFRIYLI